MLSLSRYHRCLLVVWGAASLWLAQPPVVSSADDPAPLATSSVEKSSVVLLKNDRCLTGQVRQLGDQVVIEIDSNARISRAASDVQFIADDLEGIYQYKLARFSHLGPGENIRLARWCLATGLHEHAAKHFLAVNREAGSNPSVKQLGIELREQLLKDDAFRSYLGLAPLATPGRQGPVVQTASTASAAGQTPPIIPAVITSFAEHVQPILLKRCSQSGCHGLSATNRLKFIQPIGTARARISEQNCRSALQFVEVDSSSMSVLLRYAVVAHGIQKTPSITAQEPKLVEVLQSWTTFARNPVMAAVGVAPSGTQAAATPAVYTGRPAKAVTTSDALTPLAPGAVQLRTVPQAPGPANGAPTISELDELDDQVRRALGEPPRQASPSVGVDPFDPAEFNRRAADKSSAGR